MSQETLLLEGGSSTSCPPLFQVLGDTARRRSLSILQQPVLG